MQAEEIFAIIALEAVGTRALPELGAGALSVRGRTVSRPILAARSSPTLPAATA